MNGTRIFVKGIYRTQDWATVITGKLSFSSEVFVEQYLDLFDANGELILSTKVLGLEQNGSAVETAASGAVNIKLNNVIDGDIDVGFVLVGVRTSNELLMHRSENLNYAVYY